MMADLIMRQLEYFRRLLFVAHGRRRLDADIFIQCMLRARQNIINHIDFNLNEQKI